MKLRFLRPLVDWLQKQAPRSKPHVEVRPSRHGQGAYAIHRYAKGASLGTVDGEVIHDPEYGSEYCMDLGDGYLLEPAGPFRFMNHSCEPNCRLVIVERPWLGPPSRLEVEAVREIEPGEELTIDYAWPADAAVVCGCGARSCRGWIVCPDERHLIDDSVAGATAAPNESSLSQA
jgi:hypothetical protein